MTSMNDVAFILVINSIRDDKDIDVFNSSPVWLMAETEEEMELRDFRETSFQFTHGRESSVTQEEETWRTSRRESVTGFGTKNFGYHQTQHGKT